MTSPIRSVIGDSISRSSLYEYVDIVNEIQRLSLVSASTASDKEALARQLMQQIQKLQVMMTMGMQGATKLSSLASQLIQDAAPLFQASSGNLAATFASWKEAVCDETSAAYSHLSAALDPTQWDPSNSQPLTIRDAFDDYLLYEFYRTNNNQMELSIGRLGNALQVADQFLKALNQVYAGVCWNPGKQYIDTQGQLKDISTSDTWVSQFNTVDSVTQTSPGLSMQQGITQLESIEKAGYYSPDSEEGKVITYVINKFTGRVNPDTGLPYLADHYNNLVGATNINAMWTDKEFRKKVEDAIQLVTNINDISQQKMHKMMLGYEQLSQVAINLSHVADDSLKSIAQRIQMGG